MKSLGIALVFSLHAAFIKAQASYAPANVAFICPMTGGNFCAGNSLETNIIIRCSGTIGTTGNCDDNLAGIEPQGTKATTCWQTSPSAANAACSYNGTVYPDHGMPYPLTAVTTTTTSQSPTTSSSDQSSTSVPLSQSTTTSSAPAHLAAYGTGANPAPIQYPAETTSKSSYHNKSSVYTSAIETSTASPPPPIAYPSGAPSDQAPKILPSVPNTFAPYGTGTGLVPLPSATYSSVPYPTPDNGSKPVGSGSAVPPTSSPLPGSASAPRGGYVGNNNSTVTAPATGVSAGPVITMDTSAPPTVTTKTSSVVLTSTAGARANEAGGVLLGAGMLMVAML